MLSIFALLGLAVICPCVFSKSTDGDIVVTINNTVLDPADGKDMKLDKLGALTGPIKVRGLHMSLVIDPVTLNMFNYTLTGFPDERRLVTKPTIIFSSQNISLIKAQLGSINVKSVEVKDDSAVLVFETAAGKLVQFIGGTLQMEAEFSSNIEFVHTIGPGLFYFINPFTNKTNFGDGLGPVSKAQDPVNYHTMLIGKDSPQVATRTFQDGVISRWSVAPGGRVGIVIGEDATELGPGATDCTSMCQAQNQIHDSLPNPGAPEGVPSLPTGGDD
ncbi:hypothetical protein C8R43DRAFT_1138058 [Mycena crocata]|nr:hypothetical protein C8R43DRAFT_1138058 [Mycena crocata]